MRIVIPMTPPSLDETLTYVETLAHRDDLDEPLMTERQWERAVTCAVSRSDRDGLAVLLHIELVPAVAQAMVAMAATVRCALVLAEGPEDSTTLDLAELIDPAQLAIRRAGKAVWAGEHREGLLPEHAGPSSAQAESSERAWAKMATYLHMSLASDDVHRAMAEDLGLALRGLSGPAQAAVDCMDAGEPDGVLAFPLQQALSKAYDALSAVRLYLLATYLADTMAHRVIASELS